jgi:hypothetical protein
LKITINRLTALSADDEGTFGTAILSNDAGVNMQEWYSLELPWRDNQHSISCIPEGTYSALWQYSPHFQHNVYTLQNVPNRSSIEIHPANWAGDIAKGYKSDLRGCITLGLTTTIMDGQMAVSSSGDAIRAFQNLCNGQEITVTITRTNA